MSHVCPAFNKKILFYQISFVKDKYLSRRCFVCLSLKDYSCMYLVVREMRVAHLFGDADAGSPVSHTPPQQVDLACLELTSQTLLVVLPSVSVVHLDVFRNS